MEFNEKNYYEYPAVSASGINKFLQSPFVYWKHTPFNPDCVEDLDTDAKLLGRMTHILVLESTQKFTDTYIVIPEGMRRDKRTTTFKALIDEGTLNGKTLVPFKLYQEARELADHLLMNDVARTIMQEGTFEEPMLWQRDGVDCKLKTDFFRHGLIVDYKTTRAISQDEYFKSAANLGCHRAAAWYLDGSEIVKGERPRGVMHIVQNKEYKDLIGFPCFTEEMISIGQVENNFAFTEIAKRLQSGNWEEWPQKIINAKLPEWYRAQGEWNK